MITGKPGSGKSLFLAKVVKEQLIPRGYEVWAYKSFKYKDPSVKYFSSITDIPKRPNIAVVVDEAHVFFDAYKWDELPIEFYLLLAQHRHFGWTMWFATPHASDVVPRLRRYVENYFEVLQIFGTRSEKSRVVKHPWGLFALRRFDIKEADKVKRVTSGIRFFVAGKKLFNFYDTFCLYDFESKRSDISLVEVYTCPHCRHKKVLWGKEHPVENLIENSQITAEPF